MFDSASTSNPHQAQQIRTIKKWLHQALEIDGRDVSVVELHRCDADRSYVETFFALAMGRDRERVQFRVPLPIADVRPQHLIPQLASGCRTSRHRFS